MICVEAFEVVQVVVITMAGEVDEFLFKSS